MIIRRAWAMPSSRTFTIKPIRELIDRYAHGFIVDPFSNGSRIASVTNDLTPECDADYHMDALDFLRQFPDASVDFVLYDPPYSTRQLSECYHNVGTAVSPEMTTAAYWARQKEEIGRIVKPGGGVLTCCWNSGGAGKKYGFEIMEILLVAHGGWHNDTICTVEKKVHG